MWLWDLTSQVNVFTTGYSFHLVSQRNLWKTLGLSHCGTESLVKSQEQKTPGVEENSCTQLCQMWIESCICMSCHSALPSFSILGVHVWTLSTPPAIPQAFLRQKSRCSPSCIEQKSNSAQNLCCCFTFVPFQAYYEQWIPRKFPTLVTESPALLCFYLAHMAAMPIKQKCILLATVSF